MNRFSDDVLPPMTLLLRRISTQTQLILKVSTVD